MFPAAPTSRRELPPATEAVAAEDTPAPAPAPEPAPKAGRDAFFDNAKYLAIVLVALGHAWEPLTHGGRAAEALYMVVYGFHMPAFILISGYFSRTFDFSPAKVKRLVTGVVVPYLIFEVAYAYFERWATGSEAQISLTRPYYLNWFLVALFIWRLTTPIWKLVRWPVPVAMVLAMLAATSPTISDDFDMQRVLQFLPFFVIGVHLRPEHFRMVRRRAVRIAAVPIVLVSVVFAYWAAPRMTKSWFYRNDAVQDLGAPVWTAPVMSLALFGCSLLLVACFFAWVPSRQTWFTRLGAGTLYGYLLHGFLVKASRFWGWFDAYPWLRTPLGEIAVTVIAAVVMTALCTPPVQRVFRWAMEPKMSWAFRKDPAETARARAGV